MKETKIIAKATKYPAIPAKEIKDAVKGLLLNDWYPILANFVLRTKNKPVFERFKRTSFQIHTNTHKSPKMCQNAYFRAFLAFIPKSYKILQNLTKKHPFWV